MHFGGFPFVERIGSNACCGPDGLDGMAFHVDCGSKQGLHFRECDVLFHLLTSMKKVVGLEGDSVFFFLKHSIMNGIVIPPAITGGIYTTNHLQL